MAGIPFEVIYGKPKEWNKIWRTAAQEVISEIKGHTSIPEELGGED